MEAGEGERVRETEGRAVKGKSGRKEKVSCGVDVSPVCVGL